jgi:hypothetical protein
MCYVGFNSKLITRYTGTRKLIVNLLERVVVVWDLEVAREQFGNPEEGKRPPFKAVTGGLVKIQLTQKLVKIH